MRTAHSVYSVLATFPATKKTLARVLTVPGFETYEEAEAYCQWQRDSLVKGATSEVRSFDRKGTHEDE